MDADAILAGLFTPGARADPYPHYAALRALGPVAPLRQDRPGTTPFVAVATGYRMVDQVLRDSGFYKKNRPDWREHTLLSTFETSVMFANPPDHGRYRAMFGGVFTPRRMAALEPVIARVTSQLLDTLAELGAGGAAVDFVTGFARRMPALVMAGFIGIPAGQVDWYQDRVELIDAYLDLDGKRPEVLATANQAAGELRAFYADLIATRRREPRADLISDLATAVAAGVHPVSDAELISSLIVLYNASFITTTHMLGSGLPLLLSRPDVVAALPGNGDLALRCVDEILRCEPPAQFLTRSPYQDTTLAGVPLPAHSVILLVIAAANRDPEVFPEPDRFDPYRERTASLAFGAGAHYCLGAAVSRVEGKIALPMLFERFPDLALARPPVGTGSLFLRGMSSVPVTVG